MPVNNGGSCFIAFSFFSFAQWLCGRKKARREFGSLADSQLSALNREMCWREKERERERERRELKRKERERESEGERNRREEKDKRRKREKKREK